MKPTFVQTRFLHGCAPLIVILACAAGPLSASAQVTYTGRDTPAGTGWRATAEAMIDQNRKADLDFSFAWPDGSPAIGAQAHIQMQRHAYQFGSAVDAKYFLSTGQDFDATYAQKIPELFSSAVFENQMKWKGWSNDRQIALDGLDWLVERNLDVRGHTMIWSRSQSVPTAIADLLALPNPTAGELQTLYDATFSHIADIGGATAGKIFAWDALNESRKNSEIEDKLLGFTPAGQPTIADRADLRARWFQAAVAADPNAVMMINDFQIIAGGGLADTEPQDYKNQIDGILAQGGPIQGIGFQSHFNDNTANSGNKLPTGPTDVWALLDDFNNTYDVPLHITEFSFDTTDLSLQADYTRDFLTTIFAHPSTEAFVLWGFWEGKINEPNNALFRNDWTAKPNGQAFLDLVKDQWWTDQTLDSDAAGHASLRGFKGDYALHVIHQGKSYTFGDFQLADAGINASLTLENGHYDTTLQGSNLLNESHWDSSTPTLDRTGLITGEGGDATASNRVSGMIITQTGGTVRFTNTNASRSALANGTQWYLRGGTLTDDNSSIHLRNASLFVEGGTLALGNRKIKLTRGNAFLAIINGAIEAKQIDLGATNTTGGSKVFQLGLGDGTVTLSGNTPFSFVDDGDPTDDYVDWITGSQVRLISPASAAYFETLWNAGQLRLDGKTATELGLLFEDSGISVTLLGSGLFELMLETITALAGDYNASGQVEQGDLDLVLQNWGLDTSGGGAGGGVPVGWVSDLPVGQIEQAELDRVLQNWGAASAPDLHGRAVPEPSTGVVFLLFAVFASRPKAAVWMTP